MLTHIVMWKITDKTDMRLFESKLEFLRDSFNNLYKSIPQIKRIEFKENVNFEDKRNSDISLVVEFESLKDLDTYRIHPEHMKIVEVLRSLNFDRACIDV